MFLANLEGSVFKISSGVLVSDMVGPLTILDIAAILHFCSFHRFLILLESCLKTKPEAVTKLWKQIKIFSAASTLTWEVSMIFESPFTARSSISVAYCYSSVHILVKSVQSPRIISFGVPGNQPAKVCPKVN